MAIASIGYDGSVDEGAWSKIADTLGSEYGVLESDAWRCTAKPIVDRTVQIAGGTGYGKGVFDTSDAIAEVQLDISTSGTRYDMIVARRNWSTNTTAFAAIKGGASGASLPARNMTPGTVDDQPIAIFSVTQGVSQPTFVADLRVWQANGGAVANDNRVLQYLSRPGTHLRIAGVDWVRNVASNSAVAWETIVPPFVLQGAATPIQAGAVLPVGGQLRLIAGERQILTDAWGSFTLPFAGGGFPTAVLSVAVATLAAIGANAPVSAYPVFFHRTTTIPGARPTRAGMTGRMFMGTTGQVYTNATFAISYIAIGW